jgi:hypothetical protein
MPRFRDFDYGWGADEDTPIERTPDTSAGFPRPQAAPTAPGWGDSLGTPTEPAARQTPGAAGGSQDGASSGQESSVFDRFGETESPFRSHMDAVTNAPDERTRAVARDGLARNLFSTLKQQGHDVKWQGDNLVVDGRPYVVAGGGSSPAGGSGLNSSQGSQGPPGPAVEDTGYRYQGPWRGFDANRMAGGKNDSSQNNAKYWFSQVAGGYDPTKVATDPATQQALLAALNANPFGGKYYLSDEGDFMATDPSESGYDGSYMGVRNGEYSWLTTAGNPIAYGRMLANDPTLDKDQAYQLAMQAGFGQPQAQGGGLEPSYLSLLGAQPAASVPLSSSAAKGAQAAGVDSGWQPGQTTGDTDAATKKLLLDLLANPLSMGQATTDAMKAASKDTLAETQLQNDEQLKLWAAANGYDLSPWLASERMRGQRSTDQALIKSNRDIDIEAAKTNVADINKALATAGDYKSKATDQDRVMADYVIGLISDATKRYGIDVGAQIDREKLAEMGSEFLAEMAYKYSTFGYQYGLDATRLNHEIDLDHWTRTWKA